MDGCCSAGEGAAFLHEALPGPFEIGPILWGPRDDGRPVRLADGKVNGEHFLDGDLAMEIRVFREISKAKSAVPQKTHDDILAEADSGLKRVFMLRRHGGRILTAGKLQDTAESAITPAIERISRSAERGPQIHLAEIAPSAAANDTAGRAVGLLVLEERKVLERLGRVHGFHKGGAAGDGDGDARGVENVSGRNPGGGGVGCSRAENRGGFDGRNDDKGGGVGVGVGNSSEGNRGVPEGRNGLPRPGVGKAGSGAKGFRRKWTNGSSGGVAMATVFFFQNFHAS